MNIGDEVDVTFFGTSVPRSAWIEEITNDGWVTIEFTDPRGPWRATTHQNWFTQTGPRWSVSL